MAYGQQAGRRRQKEAVRQPAKEQQFHVAQTRRLAQAEQRTEIVLAQEFLTQPGAPPLGLAVPATQKTELEVDGFTVPVSNFDKVLYPETGFTKGNLLRYYIDIGPVILPHLRNRALTMKRYPDGVGKFFFYEKNCPTYRPKWVRTAPIFSHGRGATMHYCLANNLASLVWMGSLADLELHISLARTPAVHKPTTMVFDLDPGEGASIIECSQVAFWLKEKLEAMKLASFVKTSGSKGLQLYVPLNTAVTFDQTKAAARQLGDTLVAEHPETVVTKMLKVLRRKKVLIDWSQNDEHKTTVCVYSLRATPKPQVSTPLSWDELESLWRRRDPDAFRFSPDDVRVRVKKRGDLFAPVLTLKQKLKT